MDWAASLGEFCIHRGLLGQRMISRYKEKLPKGGFLRSKGGLKGLDTVFGALIVPNRCPTRYCAQTPVTQQQENDSPNAKNP